MDFMNYVWKAMDIANYKLPLWAVALIVIGVPVPKPCGATVVTVIKLWPIPSVPALASVSTVKTGVSVPGIS